MTLDSRAITQDVIELKKERDFADINEKIVERSIKLGADEVEAYLLRLKQTTVKAHQGSTESLSSADTNGLGVRLFLNGAMGYAHTSELGEEALERLLRDALDNAKISAPDEYNGLPEPVGQVPALDIYREELAKTPIERKIETALELERTARQYDSRIVGTEQAVYTDAESEVYLANSKGFSGQYKSTTCLIYLSVLAMEKDETQTGYSFAAGRCLEELDPKHIAEEAAQKALSLLGGRPIPTREAPVVFDPFTAAAFLSVIAQALTAEAVQKGYSLFAGKVGQPVAEANVTLVDDGVLKEGIASAPFDGEGVPTQRTELIKEGVLQGFLYNTYTARKDRARSTGNARRYSAKSLPEVGPTNFFLLAGSQSPEEIIDQVEAGLYVTGLQGVHSGADPISGQFSVGATGLWIEKGKLAHPIREVTVAGEMLTMLRDIDAVGSDFRFFPLGGNFGSATVRLRKMMIAGK